MSTRASGSPIIVVGSHAPGLFMRVERPPTTGETILGWDFDEPVDGGKGSNQAIAAARLGASVSFVGCVGRDRLGDEAEHWLREAGVDVTYLQRSASAASGVGFILLDAAGVPAMATSLGANAVLSADDVDRAIAGTPHARVMLTQFEIRPEVALHAARTARLAGIAVIINPAPAPRGLLDGLDMADILVPNETEAHALLGLEPGSETDHATLAQQLRAQSRAGCVIVTVGEHGIVAADDSGVWHVRPPSVRAVDTSGAGDVFCAALAAQVAVRQTVRAAAEWACVAAALSVTRPGTIPAFPSRAEVDEACR